MDQKSEQTHDPSHASYTPIPSHPRYCDRHNNVSRTDRQTDTGHEALVTPLYAACIHFGPLDLNTYFPHHPVCSICPSSDSHYHITVKLLVVTQRHFRTSSQSAVYLSLNCSSVTTDNLHATNSCGLFAGWLHECAALATQLPVLGLVVTGKDLDRNGRKLTHDYLVFLEFWSKTTVLRFNL